MRPLRWVGVVVGTVLVAGVVAAASSHLADSAVVHRCTTYFDEENATTAGEMDRAAAHDGCLATLEELGGRAELRELLDNLGAS